MRFGYEPQPVTDNRPVCSGCGEKVSVTTQRLSMGTGHNTITPPLCNRCKAAGVSAGEPVEVWNQ